MAVNLYHPVAEVVRKGADWAWGEMLVAEARSVRAAYQRQEKPRSISVAEETFLFWMYVAWGTAIVNAGADAEERGQGHIGTMPDIDSVVRHEVAEQDIPDLTGWEYQHMRPMVRVSVLAETPVDRVIQQGINMIRIGQMGTVLALMRRQVGTKYLRIPTYNDEDGAKIIFRHQGKWCLAGFFAPRERE